MGREVVLSLKMSYCSKKLILGGLSYSPSPEASVRYK